MNKNRWTWHGGGLSAARARFGGEETDWLDLSTGINPWAWGWPETQSPAIDWRALPDEQALAALEEAAAAHFGCHPDHVCAVPGTEIGLRLAADLLPRDAAHGVPGYRTHGAMIAGSTPIAPEAMASSTAATLILANPNNPDGCLLSRDDLLALVEARSGWTALDEAFVDTHPGHSLAPMIDDTRRLVIFRSFGKFFGLAGLRLGFVLGPRPLLATLRARLGAWPVCAAALAIGTAAYRDTGWITQMRARLLVEADALDAALARRGYRATGQSPLFRLITCTDGPALFAHLAAQAILTRPFEDHPGWLRLGLPTDEAARARLIAALPSCDG